MLGSLGMFTFEIDTALYDQIRRRRSWRHPSNDRVGARPASQYAGPGDDQVNLSGRIYPGQLGNPDSLQELAEMAETGQAFPLVDGEGVVFGAFVIESLDEVGRELMTDGMPRAIEFSIDLKRVDDEAGETGDTGQTVRT